MEFKISYNNNSIDFVNEIKTILSNEFPLIDVKTFNENTYSEKKKSYRHKNSFGAKMCPFSTLTDNDKRVVAAFYSENNKCTVDNIISYLKKVILYERKN